MVIGSPRTASSASTSFSEKGRKSSRSVSRITASYLGPQFLARVFGSQLLQFLPEFTGFQIAGLRHNDLDLNNLISAQVFVPGRRYAFFPETQLLSALRSRRNLQLRPAIDGGDFDLRSQCRLHGGDRNGHINIVALAVEKRMLTGATDDVEIARTTAMHSGIAFASP